MAGALPSAPSLKHSNCTPMKWHHCGKLLSQFDMITLSVGPGPTPKLISCNKILLAYYSNFFDAMLYGSFPEATKSLIELPYDDPAEIAAFVNWVYTGNIHNCHDRMGEIEEECTEVECTMGPRLWVLGDKLLASKFCNEAMKFTIVSYDEGYMNSGTAEYLYTSTLPESKLRQFTRDLISHDGPLNEDLKVFFDRESWLLLLAKGGDLVKENIIAGFANDKPDDEAPWKLNPGQYLEEIGGQTVAEWLALKPRL